MTTSQKIIKYLAIAFAILLIVSIFSGIIGALAGISFIFGDNDVTGEMKTYELNAPFDVLEMDLSAARLEIKTGESFSLESNSKYIKVENDNESLNIKESRRVFGFHSGDIKVILTIPEGFRFRNADISVGAGDVNIDTLLADRLSLSLPAGKASINKLVVTSRAKIESGAGKFTIKSGELSDLDLDLGVGKVDINAKLCGSCDIDCGVGALELTLQGSPEDYRVTLSKGLGKATFDGEEMKDDVVYGKGETSIEIDGGVGEIKIEFEKP